jgi:hypothetical protein
MPNSKSLRAEVCQEHFEGADHHHTEALVRGAPGTKNAKSSRKSLQASKASPDFDKPSRAGLCRDPKGVGCASFAACAGIKTTQSQRLVLCGKMSEEEESKLLCELVEAFGGPCVS